MLKPRRPAYPDRQLECEEAVDIALRDLVDAAVTSGWKAEEVFEAIESVLASQRIAYAEDPDPADDPVS